MMRARIRVAGRDADLPFVPDRLEVVAIADRPGVWAAASDRLALQGCAPRAERITVRAPLPLP